MSLKNAKTLPRRYFGLHMVPGVAEYREPGKEPYRIFINNQVIAAMNPSFEGRPLYVQHVDEVDLANLKDEMDGVVVRSFYNAADGKTWCEFIVTSDAGHAAIQRGWRLSNAYVPKDLAKGGLWNGVEYQHEIMAGEYEHLALVPNPRYEESVIYTPEQFKAYNQECEARLRKLANAAPKEAEKKPKGAKPMLFDIFKRAKIENAETLEGMMIMLPKSKKEMTLEALVNAADERALTNMAGYANGDHMVKVGEEEMTVNDMASKYAEMKKNSEEEAAKKKEAEDAEKKKNSDAEDEEKKKKENEAKDKEEETKKNALYFESLKNAPNVPIKEEAPTFVDRVALGRERY